jgi:hypothetical protein
MTKDDQGKAPTPEPFYRPSEERRLQLARQWLSQARGAPPPTKQMK